MILLIDVFSNVLLFLLCAFVSHVFLIVLALMLKAVINFFNLMDGLDGLVAGCMVVATNAVAFQLSASWPIWLVVVGFLGFLCWNWIPVKVLMPAAPFWGNVCWLGDSVFQLAIGLWTAARCCTPSSQRLPVCVPSIAR